LRSIWQKVSFKNFYVSSLIDNTSLFENIELLKTSKNNAIKKWVAFSYLLLLKTFWGHYGQIYFLDGSKSFRSKMNFEGA